MEHIFKCIDSLRARLSGGTVIAGVASALWAPARAQARLGGVLVSGHWREVGTPADYLEGTMALLGDRNDRDPSARIAPDAVLNSTLIGPDVAIRQGVVVGQSIISHGAMVGAGARIIRSVVLGGVEIHDGETVTGEHSVTKSAWRGLGKGSDVTVEYLSLLPALNRVERPDRDLVFFIFAALTLVFLWLAGMSIYRSFVPPPD